MRQMYAANESGNSYMVLKKHVTVYVRNVFSEYIYLQEMFFLCRANLMTIFEWNTKNILH